MLKKKSFYIALIFIGASLFGAALLGNFAFEMQKIVAGICLGIGTVLLAIGIPNLLTKLFETAQPELMKQNQIEIHDERNTMIRNMAKAKTVDIIQWLIMGIVYVSILVEAPQWILFTLVGLFVLKGILETVFTIKYQKEL